MKIERHASLKNSKTKAPSQFKKKVLEQMALIPFGQTITYAELAKRAGNPKAYRAAASVCARNDSPIIYPCHRVVGSDGKLNNYGFGGPEVKKWLLEFEKLGLFK
jgi:methylated-DNA-[protein]-cysteine S-methyltransferase